MSRLRLAKRVRRAYRAVVRRRPYALQIKVVDASTDISRQTLLSPSPGRRLRFTRVKVLQEVSDGSNCCTLVKSIASSINMTLSLDPFGQNANVQIARAGASFVPQDDIYHIGDL